MSTAKASGDVGGDLSNAIISDLAPLIALFGEQVTKQFMSQSMGWYDHIIFAMAPLGIITAIVSAIRVAGSTWLKALIGRARESLGAAEVELMSSTSHNVCELWNGSQIVRIMGSSPVVQILYFPDYYKAASTAGSGSETDETPGEEACGLFTVEEAVRAKLLTSRSSEDVSRVSAFCKCPPSVLMHF